LKVETFTVGEFQENTYLLVDEASKRAALIDPGGEPDRIIEAIEKSGAELDAIWITHAHVDHVGAIAPIKRRWNVPVYLHAKDRRLYEAAGIQAQLYGIPFEEPPPPEREFADGQSIQLGQIRLSVMHVPGHAPGHVVLYGNGVAFVGDCIFAGSIGRTDLPFSNPSDLTASLERIAALPPATVLYPGHGMSTTIMEERESNPFLNGSARVLQS
jgi:glyoxylase-like metal-dependent hydrolase (beta-lactamase superfamily II)